MKNIKIILSIAIASVVFSGCSMSMQNDVEVNKIRNKNVVYKTNTIMPYDDIVNMGQYAEAWIAPYKDDKDDLFDERVMKFWVVNPTFKSGEELPNKENIKDGKKLQVFNIDKTGLSKIKDIQLDKNVLNYLEKGK